MIIIIILVVISENFIIYQLSIKYFVPGRVKKKRPFILFTFLNVSSPPLQTTPKRRIRTTTSFDYDARAHIIIVFFNNRVY